MEAYYLHTILKWKRGFALYNLFILYKSLEETHRNGNPDRIHLVCASILFWLVILISIAYSPIIGYIGKLSNGNLIQSFSSHWLFICRVQLACRVNTHNFSFIFIQNINIAYYFKTKEAGVLDNLFEETHRNGNPDWIHLVCVCAKLKRLVFCFI